MFTPAFLVAALERAVKSAANAILLNLGASDTGPANMFQSNLTNVAAFAATGAVISVLMSIVSYGASPGGSPSLVPKAEVDSTFQEK